jgi:hypothetical protein
LIISEFIVDAAKFADCELEQQRGERGGGRGLQVEVHVRWCAQPPAKFTETDLLTDPTDFLLNCLSVCDFKMKKQPSAQPSWN